MFYQPKSIGEALDLKAELRERAVFIAGGTDLVVLMNRGARVSEHFIDLTHVPELKAISQRNGSAPSEIVGQAAGLPKSSPTAGGPPAPQHRTELGGNVTFAQAGKLPIRCLAQASLSVGGPGIRELGTLAGNLATASPAGDGSTALLALDAEVELRSVRGARRLPLEKFFLGYRKTALATDEMITKISVPANYRSDWAKVGKRGAVNISIVAAAVAITPKKEVRIALASVAPTPMRCYKAERAFTNGADAPRVADIARTEIKPITDHRASADYKTHLAGVMVRRLLESLTR